MASVPARVRETKLAVVEAPGSSLRTLPVLQASSSEQQGRERVGCQEPRLERPSLTAPRPSGVESILVSSVAVEQPILSLKLRTGGISLRMASASTHHPPVRRKIRTVAKR